MFVDQEIAGGISPADLQSYTDATFTISDAVGRHHLPEAQEVRSVRRPNVSVADWRDAEPVMRFVLALDDRDPDRAASLFAFNATVTTSTESAFSGRDAIREHYHEAMQGGDETRHILTNVSRVHSRDGVERSVWYALIIMENPSRHEECLLITAVYEFWVDLTKDLDGPITEMKLSVDDTFALVRQ
jgi:hypothetical protein